MIVQISQMKPAALPHVTLRKGTVTGQMRRLETTMTGFVTGAKPLQNLLGLLLIIHTTHQQVCVTSHVFYALLTGVSLTDPQIIMVCLYAGFYAL